MRIRLDPYAAVALPALLLLSLSAPARAQAMGLTPPPPPPPSAPTDPPVATTTYQASLPARVVAPSRIAAAQDGYGGLYAVDAAAQATAGQVTYLTGRGEVRGIVSLPERALAVAQGAGSLWVTTGAGSLLRIDSGSGRLLGPVPLAGGPLLRPSGVAYEPTRQVIWIAEWDASRVRGVRPDGSTAAILTTAGAAPLGAPVDVAVDPAGGRLWVLDGEKNPAGLLLHAFDLDGNYAGSYLDPSALSRGGGVATGPDGRVYVSDAFQGTVTVLDRSGAAVGTLGAFGEQAGQLIAPAGLALLVNGDVAVASPTNGRIERYGAGAPLPAACTAFGQLDTDCDGLPDAWELAHGLNPRFAGDALLAFGSTGLTNYEVAAYQATHGTDPWTPPTVAVTAPARTPPGLVRLLATTSGPPSEAVACRWRQLSGPAEVTLSGAATSAPTFVARAAGVYGFEVVASTSLASGRPTPVQVEVTNVPPVADVPRVVVSAPGRAVRLDAGLSSDANGDALTFSWDQTLGPAVTGTVAGAPLVLRPRGPGLYRVMLTATDANGASSAVEVPVLVTERAVSAALPAASPSPAQVGQTVSLDGTGSLFEDAFPVFAWEQIEGPPVALSGPSRPVATFVPPAAGRYAFALTVSGSGRTASPPARVDVYVTEAGQGLPVVQSASTPDPVVAVGAPVALTAAGTGSGLVWRQVAGPAAGLTDADRATATAVPFSPGFHAFEVTATDGAAVGPPARVAFEARAGGRLNPVARAAVLGPPPVAGQLVFLDGRASTGASRWRWTQVAGPWLPLEGQGAVVGFRPASPGAYAFELEVDDGRVRSAPARVDVNVSEEGVH